MKTTQKVDRLFNEFWKFCESNALLSEEEVSRMKSLVEDNWDTFRAYCEESVPKRKRKAPDAVQTMERAMKKIVAESEDPVELREKLRSTLPDEMKDAVLPNDVDDEEDPKSALVTAMNVLKNAEDTDVLRETIRQVLPDPEPEAVLKHAMESVIEEEHENVDRMRAKIRKMLPEPIAEQVFAEPVVTLEKAVKTVVQQSGDNIEQLRDTIRKTLPAEIAKDVVPDMKRDENKEKQKQALRKTKQRLEMLASDLETQQPDTIDLKQIVKEVLETLQSVLSL